MVQDNEHVSEPAIKQIKESEEFLIPQGEGSLRGSDEEQRKDLHWEYSVAGTVPQTDIGFNLQASLLILGTT